MKPTYTELARMLALTLAALETPGDLTNDELGNVKEDASAMLAAVDGVQDDPDGPASTIVHEVDELIRRDNNK